MRELTKPQWPCCPALAGQGAAEAAGAAKQGTWRAPAGCKRSLPVGVALAATVWPLCRRPRRRRGGRIVGTAQQGSGILDPGSPLDLLADESGPIMLWPSVNTITFYEGEAPTQFVRERVEELLAANPWLGGRLVAEASASGPGRVRLWVPATPCWTRHFVELQEAGLNPAEPVEAMGQRLAGVLVGSGAMCLGSEEPLFRVALVHTQPRCFALVVSLSHVLGDGHTYYRVCAGLGCRGLLGLNWPNPVIALDPRRRREFPAAAAWSLGPSKVAWLGSWPARLGDACSRWLKPPHHWGAWQVDMDWVRGQKQAATKAAAGMPWVSTNDVLTSWFLSRGGYSYGFMSVNFRGRLAGLGDRHAGNYEGGLQFWPDEFGTPAGIRRSQRAPPRFRAGRSDTPGLVTSLRGRFGVVTNWASLQQEIGLPGCQQVLHLPVLTRIALDGAMIIFRPRADALAVLIAERQKRGHAHEQALGERIC